MITNCSITIYNKYLDAQLKEKWKKTVIRKTNSTTGANWQGDKVSTISSAESSKGMVNMADVINIWIPFVNEFGEKTYIEPTAWSKLAEIDRDKYFTFQKLDKVVKGECAFEFISSTTTPIATLDKSYDNITSIMSIGINDNGSKSMQHWKLGGK